MPPRYEERTPEALIQYWRRFMHILPGLLALCATQLESLLDAGRMGDEGLIQDAKRRIKELLDNDARGIFSNHEELLRLFELFSSRRLHLEGIRSMLHDCRQMLTIVRPFNVLKTEDIVNRTENSDTPVPWLGNPCIIVLGVSGSGKTTTALYLSRFRMELKQEAGFTFPGPASGQDIPQGARVQPRPTAETSRVYAVARLPPASLRDFGYGGDKDVFMLDTPGLNDDLGAEVDVANLLTIRHSLGQASEVYPVVLLANADGNQVILQRCLNTLVHLFSNPVDAVRRCSFLFTRNTGTREAWSALVASIDHLQHDASHLSDDDPYRAVMQEIHTRLQAEGNDDDVPSLFTVQPLQSDRIGTHFQHILGRGTITPRDLNPAVHLPPEAEDRVNRELQTTRDVVTRLCGADQASSVQFVLFQVWRLWRLHRLVHLQDVNTALEECKQCTRGYLQRLLQALDSHLTVGARDSIPNIGNNTEDLLNALKQGLAFALNNGMPADLYAPLAEYPALMQPHINNLSEVDDNILNSWENARLCSLRLYKLRELCTQVPHGHELAGRYTAAVKRLIDVIGSKQGECATALSSDVVENRGRSVQLLMDCVAALCRHLQEQAHELIPVGPETRLEPYSPETPADRLPNWYTAFQRQLQTQIRDPCLNATRALSIADVPAADMPSRNGVVLEAFNLVRSLQFSQALQDVVTETFVRQQQIECVTAVRSFIDRAEHRLLELTRGYRFDQAPTMHTIMAQASDFQYFLEEGIQERVRVFNTTGHMLMHAFHQQLKQNSEVVADILATLEQRDFFEIAQPTEGAEEVTTATEEAVDGGLVEASADSGDSGQTSPGFGPPADAVPVSRDDDDKGNVWANVAAIIGAVGIGAITYANTT